MFWTICEIPTKIGQDSAIIATKIATRFDDFLENCEQITKIHDENLPFFQVEDVASGLDSKVTEECKSDSSRQDLNPFFEQYLYPNEYVFAKIGFDTAENESIIFSYPSGTFSF